MREQLENTFKREIALARARLQQEINVRLAALPEHRREFATRALERVMQRFYGEADDRIRPIISVILDALEKDEYWTVVQHMEEARDAEVQVFAAAHQT